MALSINRTTLSIQVLHRPENPDERPEDCSYGTIEQSGSDAVPAVGDLISTEDLKEPLERPIVVLTRFFSYMGDRCFVNIVGRWATDHEIGRAIKE